MCIVSKKDEHRLSNRICGVGEHLWAVGKTSRSKSSREMALQDGVRASHAYFGSFVDVKPTDVRS